MEELRKKLFLYAVTDSAWLHGRTLVSVVEEAILAGVTMVQYREKNGSPDVFFKEAEALQRLCERYQIPLIINDSVGIAKQVGAAGVHLGKQDGKIAEARQLLGRERVIGASARTVEQAVEAQKEGADYLGVGAVFGTNTKLDAETISPTILKAICAAVSIPVVAIGGISKENIGELSETGIAGAAVVSGIFAQRDISGSVRELRENLQKVVAFF